MNSWGHSTGKVWNHRKNLLPQSTGVSESTFPVNVDIKVQFSTSSLVAFPVPWIEHFSYCETFSEELGSCTYMRDTSECLMNVDLNVIPRYFDFQPPVSLL